MYTKENVDFLDSDNHTAKLSPTESQLAWAERIGVSLGSRDRGSARQFLIQEESRLAWEEALRRDMKVGQNFFLDGLVLCTVLGIQNPPLQSMWLPGKIVMVRIPGGSRRVHPWRLSDALKES